MEYSDDHRVKVHTGHGLQCPARRKVRDWHLDLRLSAGCGNGVPVLGLLTGVLAGPGWRSAERCSITCCRQHHLLHDGSFKGSQDTRWVARGLSRVTMFRCRRLWYGMLCRQLTVFGVSKLDLWIMHAIAYMAHSPCQRGYAHSQGNLKLLLHRLKKSHLTEPQVTVP